MSIGSVVNQHFKSVVLLLLLITNLSNSLNAQISLSSKKVFFNDVFCDSLEEIVFFFPTLNIDSTEFIKKFEELKTNLYSNDSIHLKYYLFQESPKSKSKGLKIIEDSVTVLWINQLEVFFNNIKKPSIIRSIEKLDHKFKINDNDTKEDSRIYNIDITDSLICFKSIEYHVPYYSDLINELINPIYSQDEINSFIKNDIIYLKNQINSMTKELEALRNKVDHTKRELKEVKEKNENKISIIKK